MVRLFEYYISVGLLSVATICMLYIILLPLPVARAIGELDTPTAILRHTQFKSGIPTRLVVPSVGIDKSIKVGSFDKTNQVWTLDDTGIFFADASVPANENNGTTVIYGHDRWGVFGTLPDLESSAVARVYTDSGFVFNYLYTSYWQTVSSDVSVFTNAGAPKLVLQTCAGVWSEQRGLYSFNLVEVETE